MLEKSKNPYNTSPNHPEDMPIQRTIVKSQMLPPDASTHPDDLCWFVQGRYFDVVMSPRDGAWSIYVDSKRVDSRATRDEAEACIREIAKAQGIELSLYHSLLEEAMKPRSKLSIDQTREGDRCSHCKTRVKAKMSGIACACGRLWFCF